MFFPLTSIVTCSFIYPLAHIDCFASQVTHHRKQGRGASARRRVKKTTITRFTGRNRGRLSPARGVCSIHGKRCGTARSINQTIASRGWNFVVRLFFDMRFHRSIFPVGTRYSGARRLPRKSNANICPPIIAGALITHTVSCDTRTIDSAVGRNKQKRIANKTTKAVGCVLLFAKSTADWRWQKTNESYGCTRRFFAGI